MRIAVFGPGADTAAAAPGGLPAGYKLVGIASDVPWGKASTALVEAMHDERLIGVIALDRNASHLAEQIGVKSFVPVLAISNDRALTSVNIPWIFRLPAGTPLEQAVQLLAGATRTVGANRGRVRALLASGTAVAGSLRFDTTGELKR